MEKGGSEVFWHLGQQSVLMSWMWDEESGRIKDNFHVFGLTNERTIKDTAIGKAGARESWQRVKAGVRNEEHKSGSLRGRLFWTYEDWDSSGAASRDSRKVVGKNARPEPEKGPGGRCN